MYPEANLLAQVIYAHNYDTPPSPTNALPQGRPKTNTWILRRRAHRLAVTAGCVGGDHLAESSIPQTDLM